MATSRDPSPQFAGRLANGARELVPGGFSKHPLGLLQPIFLVALVVCGDPPLPDCGKPATGRPAGFAEPHLPLASQSLRQLKVG